MSDTLSPRKTRAALRVSARVSGELLLVLAMAVVAVWALGRMWSVVWPLVVGLLLTTLTWPLARYLRRLGWPPALAASVVTVGFLVVALGVVALIAVPVASQSGELADGVVGGIQKVREWASGPPLNISDDQITGAFDSATARIQDSLGSMVTTVVTGVSTVVNGVVTAVLAVFLMFFMLKDGPKFLPWLARQLPGRFATDVPVVAERGWETLGGFVRSQAYVGLLDAVLIGLGLWIVGVPLVLPLAVLTFVSAFVPIVGALFMRLRRRTHRPGLQRTDRRAHRAGDHRPGAAARGQCVPTHDPEPRTRPARRRGPARGDTGRQPGRHRGQPARRTRRRAGRRRLELPARTAQRAGGGAGDERRRIRGIRPRTGTDEAPARSGQGPGP